MQSCAKLIRDPFKHHIPPKLGPLLCSLTKYTPAVCWTSHMYLHGKCPPNNSAFFGQEYRKPRQNRRPRLKARWSLLHIKCLTFVQVIAALVHHSEDSLESMVFSATYKPDIFTLLGPRVFQSAIARIDTMGDNTPCDYFFRKLIRCMIVRRGNNSLFNKMYNSKWNRVFLMASTEPDRRQRHRAQSWRCHNRLSGNGLS